MDPRKLRRAGSATALLICVASLPACDTGSFSETRDRICDSTGKAVHGMVETASEKEHHGFGIITAFAGDLLANLTCRTTAENLEQNAASFASRGG
jgi:hypothetical protein